MKTKSSLCEKLPLEHPIIIAPMFLVSNKEMLLAAAEAGILAIMPSLNARTPEILKQDLEYLKSRTKKPFGINITIKLSDPERLEQDILLCLEYQVPVLVTSYGNPTDIVKRAHDRNMLVFHDVINLKHAKKAESAGVDAIIGVAAGAGGHAGIISPYVLFPYLKENLSVPIIAAGCIASGRQMAASFALGAEMVYMGTRFIACTESQAADEYKKAVINGIPDDIVYTDSVTGTHANFIKDTVPGLSPDEDLNPNAKRWKEIWSAGQGICLAKDIKPIKEIVNDIIREYKEVVSDCWKRN